MNKKIEEGTGYGDNFVIREMKNESGGEERRRENT